ncbi:MAG: SCP2 sterol-binding domain-containing protein [Actinobacteria bacterium]|nr:SCP2 sterol-binding domain-containing protein [Actinomycetota bacterium]
MFTPEELMAVEPAAFATAVAAAPDHELAEGMATEFRVIVLDEVFRRMEAHFEPKRSKKLNIVIQFHLTGSHDGNVDVYQVIIRDDRCATGKELTEPAKLTLRLDAVDFLKLATNNEKGMDLYIKGRLKVDGNLILATRLQGLFLIPDADSAAPAPPATTASAATDSAPAAGTPAPAAPASATTSTSPAASAPAPQSATPTPGAGDLGTGPDESKEQMQDA